MHKLKTFLRYLQSTSASVKYFHSRQAAICYEYGKELKIDSLETSATIPSSHIFVSAKTSAVTFPDLLMTQGKYQIKPNLPFIAGRELCGEVLEVGQGVEGFAKGDRVFCFLPEAGGWTSGSYIPHKHCFHLPHDMEFEAASCLITSYLTAYLALAHRGDLQEGQTVLISGASGAIGLAGLDIAANVFKAKVIAICGSSQKCEVARNRGAFATIDHSKEAIKSTVMSITENRGVDLFFDVVGGEIFGEGFKCLNFEGKVVIAGFASGVIPEVSAGRLLLKNTSALGFTQTNYFYHKRSLFSECLQEVLQLYHANYITPTLSKSFPLNDINAALQFIRNKESFGRVVLDLKSQ